MDALVPLVDGVRFIARPGMHGATGNIYVGLMEFEDMAFVLHFLQASDEFIDVGANVGIYSLLAATRCKKVMAIEPVPSTYELLKQNVHLNELHEIVALRNFGVSDANGELLFSSRDGAMNHVLVGGEDAVGANMVSVERLDDLARDWCPALIKVDVEGFEEMVVAGADNVLRDGALKAVLIELNGLGARYGFSDISVHNSLIDKGFEPVCYDPFTRRLIRASGSNRGGNTLYVRGLDEVEGRLKVGKDIQINKALI